MKIQDILFFIILGFLLYKREPRNFVLAGLICLAVSIPLFAGWVFFTAERLTWYAAFYLFVFLLYYLRDHER